jgi:hypothetical protein
MIHVLKRDSCQRGVLKRDRTTSATRSRAPRTTASEQLTIFLDHDRFVGYQYGGATLALRGSGHLRLRATTTRGLALGDRLRIGRLIYGPAFQISSAQGGTWKVHTATGTLRGYAYGHPRHGDVSPRSLVGSIDPGDTGCPALSP